MDTNMSAVSQVLLAILAAGIGFSLRATQLQVSQWVHAALLRRRWRRFLKRNPNPVWHK